MITLPSATPVLAAGAITDFNIGLTFWTGVTFVFLLAVLWKYAWGPIVKMLGDRERTIRDAIESAKRERTEAERLLSDQKASLAQAQREAAELALRSKQEVEQLRQELTAKARQEADALLAEARRQIAEELLRARADLRAQVVDLAIDAASRLVKGSLDEKAQRALVEEYIAQLPANRAA